MKRLRGWLLNGVLIGASLLAALFLVEIAVRTFAPQPTGMSHQDRYGLQMHWPGITRYLPEYGHDISFNADGLRDVEHEREKLPRVFRILLLGDSFMEAMQVPFEQSMPYLVAKELSARSGQRIEVINAGVSGWGTDDQLRYLTEYGLQYDPDLVVVAVTLHNDVSDNLREYWHRMEGGVLIEQARQPASLLEYKKIELKAFLASRFQLYQLWRRVRHGGEIQQAGRQLTSHVAQMFQEPTPEAIRRGFALTSRLMERLQATAAAAGAPTVLVLLPIRYQLSDATFAEFAAGSGVSTDSMDIHAPQRRLTNAVDGLDISIIDLLPGFRQWTADDGAPLYLEWDGHWNATGHRVAASLVVDGLLEAGFFDAEPGTGAINR